VEGRLPEIAVFIMVLTPKLGHYERKFGSRLRGEDHHPPEVGWRLMA